MCCQDVVLKDDLGSGFMEYFRWWQTGTIVSAIRAAADKLCIGADYQRVGLPDDIQVFPGIVFSQ